jgi:hydroxyethylthiazole kinase
VTGALWQDIGRIRTEAPLVHNITNYVVMNTTANALLALGATPVMAHAPDEMLEMVAMARALVINMGTLSAPWIEAMLIAGLEARRKSVPVVIDPVGAGATTLRTATAERLIRECRPSVIRGNASEIRALAYGEMGTKGVDATHPADGAVEAACILSRRWGAVVAISGRSDIVVEADAIITIDNGHPMMSRVTGLGCTATALTGAFLAVNPSPHRAAAHALAVLGIAGEIAAERSAGPGSLQVSILDALHAVTEADVAARLRMSESHPTSA